MATWSLFDPKVVPHFPDLYGEEFEAAYIEAEEKQLFTKQVKARDLYSRHDENACSDRQRLDDIQRRQQPKIESDR
jgi:hypothetical protein